MPTVARSVEDVKETFWENVEVGENTIWSNPFDVMNSIMSSDGNIHSYEDYFWQTDLPEKLYTLINKNLIYPNESNQWSHALFLLTQAEQLFRINNIKPGINSLNLHFLRSNKETGVQMYVYYTNGIPCVRKALVVPMFDITNTLKCIKVIYKSLNNVNHLLMLNPNEITALIRVDR